MPCKDDLETAWPLRHQYLQLPGVRRAMGEGGQPGCDIWATVSSRAQVHLPGILITKGDPDEVLGVLLEPKKTCFGIS